MKIFLKKAGNCWPLNLTYFVRTDLIDNKIPHFHKKNKNSYFLFF